MSILPIKFDDRIMLQECALSNPFYEFEYESIFVSYSRGYFQSRLNNLYYT